MAGPLSGVPLAFSWLTVLPVRGPSDIDRTAGRRAIAAAPLTGIALGIAATFLLWGGTTSVGLNPYLAGLLTVGALALGTRGMHVDGLADSVDGLGCYGPPERAREVMHSGGAGPFGGVAALFIFLGLQSVSFASSLLPTPPPRSGSPFSYLSLRVVWPSFLPAAEVFSRLARADSVRSSPIHNRCGPQSCGRFR